MRVATVFTGVAAATAGITQVANAQDAALAAHKPTSRLIARNMRPAAESKFGSIKSSPGCALDHNPGIHPTWLHLDWYYAQGEASYSECYGYKGQIFSPPGVGVTYECGGNNHGQIRGYSKGKSWYFNFGPGTTYAHINKASLWAVSIWSWTGADKCPLHT
jgi:hypothetical protein